ncbi:MAG: molybdenum cofactor guanylyltransferase [Candidatus Lokiarchaeota archaeon]|nr:molybdenum cofactor guanylyltransferase [Candidatus Lokiarchaeota archaeon]
MSIRNKSLAFVILIGGKSNRFGSEKGLFKFRGKALIDYQLDTLSRFENDIFLIANSKQQVQKYINSIDVKRIMGFIVDENDTGLEQESRLPLIGLYSAFKELKKIGYEKALILPCDTPLVKYKVIDFLIKQCKKFDCCIPQWQNNLLEPLIAIYTIKKAYESSLRNIEQNQYKLTRLISKDWKVNYVSIEQDFTKIDPNLLSFKNINKIEDIKMLESILNKTQ